MYSWCSERFFSFRPRGFGTVAAFGFGQNAEKFGDIERFGEIGRSAGSHQSLDLSGSGIGTDDDDRNVLGFFFSLQSREHIPARQIRKMKIQKNQVREI